jgi:hypothetical protein
MSSESEYGVLYIVFARRVGPEAFFRVEGYFLLRFTDKAADSDLPDSLIYFIFYDKFV